jgi:hypothetical protein
MLKRNTVAALVGLFCLLTAAAASAQPRWGRERMPQSGVCFYENINFGGRYFCVAPGERLPSMPAGLGDQVSSLRVIGRADVTVFRDANMRGRSARFDRDVRDLRRQGWNDQISSIAVGGPRDERGLREERVAPREAWRGDRPPVWGNEALPREGACFYRDRDFRGPYFCVPRGGTYSSLPRGFNDNISSIRVLGAGVRIYQDRDFRGRTNDIRRDVTDLRGNWRDNISSVRVY